MDAAVERLVGFGRLLRKRGLPVGTNRILAFCRSVVTLGPIDRDDLYWAGRASLVAHPDHTDAFDRAFDDYFGRSKFDEVLQSMFSGVRQQQPPQIEIEVEEAISALGEEAPDEETDEESVVRLIASATEVLRAKSFDTMTEDERAHAERLIRSLAVHLPERRSRRLRRAARGVRFDLRRTLRSSLRTQGEPFERAWLAPRIKARPLVLLLDISGSMSAYARALMQFGFAARAAGQRVEVFCFGTRLTRVTRALKTRDVDRAMETVSYLVRDWEGGTRIGESLKSLLDDYSQAAALKGSVVVVCSDGLERGDPDLLGAQMARLHRIAHEIVWVNPLKGDPRYEPLARGMAVALPHIDHFLAGHNLASLDALCDALVS
ncbi:MAG: vWA domain-containing protein [Actinomycetota bacterium]